MGESNLIFKNYEQLEDNLESWHMLSFVIVLYVCDVTIQVHNFVVSTE